MSDQTKYTLTTRDDRVITLRVGLGAFEAPDVACQGEPCPRKGERPLRVVGSGREIDPENRHDTYRADGHCTACGGNVGVIRAKVSTLFGIEEDERVLGGRARVY